MNENKKVFAFKLADKNQKTNISNEQKTKTFKARDGVAIAGCTDPSGRWNVRYSDNGMYC
ncbi:MAG: hypothetical protein ACI8WB_005300 [Phenylobacterium sp.]|jgi:hypothetical protein